MSHPEYIVGQIWKNRRNKPTSTFLITKLYERHYKDGNSALRAKGVVVLDLCHGGAVVKSNDLDARSLAKMYPYILFSIPPYHDPDDGK